MTDKPSNPNRYDLPGIRRAIECGVVPAEAFTGINDPPTAPPSAAPQAPNAQRRDVVEAKDRLARTVGRRAAKDLAH